MSYTGIHRKSLLGVVGGWISGLIELAAVFWLTFEGFHGSREAPNFLLFEAGLLGSLIVAVVMHECGHLLVGLAAGEPVRTLRIGSGPTVFGFRVAGLAVQVGLNLLGGGAVGFSVADGAPGFKRLASLIAGPFVNLLAGCYAAFLYQYTGEGWLGVFALANAICFISSAMPSTSTVGGVAHPSDGMQVIWVLFKPEARAAMPNFMASAMTDEALKVMVRAAEDAVLSGSAEVSDWGLLRGLARDQAVGELFASVRLDARIPPPPRAESTQMERPTFSPVAHAALDVAFKEGRAMGIDRPDPACICLGLLLTECPAGRLLKEAGITEDAVRKVASVAARKKRARAPSAGALVRPASRTLGHGGGESPRVCVSRRPGGWLAACRNSAPCRGAGGRSAMPRRAGAGADWIRARLEAESSPTPRIRRGSGPRAGDVAGAGLCSRGRVVADGPDISDRDGRALSWHRRSKRGRGRADSDLRRRLRPRARERASLHRPRAQLPGGLFGNLARDVDAPWHGPH